MNVAMHFSDNIEDDDQSELTVNCQNQIKSAFTEMIYKTRNTQVPILTSNFHKWNRYDETLFLESARETSRKNHIYSLHKALELNERNTELENLLKHLLELELLAYEYVNTLFFTSFLLQFNNCQIHQCTRLLFYFQFFIEYFIFKI